DAAMVESDVLTTTRAAKIGRRDAASVMRPAIALSPVPLCASVSSARVAPRLAANRKARAKRRPRRRDAIIYDFCVPSVSEPDAPMAMPGMVTVRELPFRLPAYVRPAAAADTNVIVLPVWVYVPLSLRIRCVA